MALSDVFRRIAETTTTPEASIFAPTTTFSAVGELVRTYSKPMRVVLGSFRKGASVEETVKGLSKAFKKSTPIDMLRLQREVLKIVPKELARLLEQFFHSHLFKNTEMFRQKAFARLADTAESIEDTYARTLPHLVEDQQAFHEGMLTAVSPLGILTKPLLDIINTPLFKKPLSWIFKQVKEKLGLDKLFKEKLPSLLGTVLGGEKTFIGRFLKDFSKSAERKREVMQLEKIASAIKDYLPPQMQQAFSLALQGYYYRVDEHFRKLINIFTKPRKEEEEQKSLLEKIFGALKDQGGALDVGKLLGVGEPTKTVPVTDKLEGVREPLKKVSEGVQLEQRFDKETLGKLLEKTVESLKKVSEGVQLEQRFDKETLGKLLEKTVESLKKVSEGVQLEQRFDKETLGKLLEKTVESWKNVGGQVSDEVKTIIKYVTGRDLAKIDKAALVVEKIADIMKQEQITKEDVMKVLKTVLEPEPIATTTTVSAPTATSVSAATTTFTVPESVTSVLNTIHEELTAIKDKVFKIDMSVERSQRVDEKKGKEERKWRASLKKSFEPLKKLEGLHKLLDKIGTLLTFKGVFDVATKGVSGLTSLLSAGAGLLFGKTLFRKKGVATAVETAAGVGAAAAGAETAAGAARASKVGKFLRFLGKAGKLGFITALLYGGSQLLFGDGDETASGAEAGGTTTGRPSLGKILGGLGGELVGGAIGGRVIGGLAGRVLGGALGTFLGPVGTIAGWAIGGYLGSKLGGFLGEKVGELFKGSEAEASTSGGVLSRTGQLPIERPVQTAESVTTGAMISNIERPPTEMSTTPMTLTREDISAAIEQALINVITRFGFDQWPKQQSLQMRPVMGPSILPIPLDSLLQYTPFVRW